MYLLAPLKILFPLHWTVHVCGLNVFTLLPITLVRTWVTRALRSLFIE